MIDIINYYNNNVDLYYNKTINLKYSKYLDIFLKNLHLNSKIIDYGCGFGKDIKYMNNKGYNNIIGIDSSINMINKAKEFTNNHNIFYNNYDIDINNIKPNSIDAIWANSSLLHCGISELYIILNDINIVLKNKGLLFVSIKDFETIEDKIEWDLCKLKITQIHFLNIMDKHNFKCIYNDSNISITNNKTIWYNYFFELNKKV